MKSDTFKGYLFALISTIAFSNVYIFSKAALNEVHLIQFGIYWFAISTILNFLYVTLTGKLTRAKYLSKRQILILLILGILEILTTSTFFISVNIIPDPAVTSFLGNLYPVMLVLGGVIVLNERFGPAEAAGAALALAGAFVISYTGETSLKKIFIPGTGVILLNAVFATSASLVVKIHVKKISPELINLNRSVWLLVFSAILLVAFRQPVAIPPSALKNIAIGAILGPFVSILTVYYSFKYLEASRSSIVQSLKGIFVLAGAYLFFGTFPQTHQIAGGLLTIAGILTMTLFHKNIIRRRKPD